jgi:chromosome segregation ATPase
MQTVPYFHNWDIVDASNNNFNYTQTRINHLEGCINQLTSANQNLISQINSLNAQISLLQKTSIDNKTQLQANLVEVRNDFKQNADNLSKNISDCKASMDTLQDSFNTINDKLKKLLTFIPYFVKYVSDYLIKILIHSKNGTLEQIEPPQNITNLLE